MNKSLIKIATGVLLAFLLVGCSGENETRPVESEQSELTQEISETEIKNTESNEEESNINKVPIEGSTLDKDYTEYPFNKTDVSVVKFGNYIQSSSVKDLIFVGTIELEMPNDTLFDNNTWIYSLSSDGVEKVRELIDPDNEKSDYISLDKFLPNLSSNMYITSSAGFLRSFYSCHGENNVTYSTEIYANDSNRDKNFYEQILADTKSNEQFGVKVVELPAIDNHRSFLSYRTHYEYKPDKTPGTEFNVTYELGKYGYFAINFNYGKNQFAPNYSQTNSKERHLTEQDMIEIANLFLKSIKSATFTEIPNGYFSN